MLPGKTFPALMQSCSWRWYGATFKAGHLAVVKPAAPADELAAAPGSIRNKGQDNRQRANGGTGVMWP